MRTQRLVLLPITVATLFLAGACSSGGDDASDDVATLGGDTSNDDSTSDDDGGGQGGRQIDPEFQDAMVDFAECMREHGIDMPDPQMNGEGGIMIGGPAGAADGEAPSEAEQEAFEAANEACQSILEEVEGSMPQPDPEQLAEMQEDALEFAQCMREHGIDMPDPVFSEDGGRATVEVGGGAGEGNDTAPAFNPEDDDFQEAAEACGQDGGFGFSVSSDAADTEDDE